MQTSLGVRTNTRDRLERVKRKLSLRSMDETVNRLLDAFDGSAVSTPSHTMLERMKSRKKELAQFAKKYDVRRIAVFGSVIHGDARPDSDLDVLVEFLPGRGTGFLGFARMETELSARLGAKVDLQTPASLSKYFRDEVLAEAVEVYAQA